jgi:hypothetical protein
MGLTGGVAIALLPVSQLNGTPLDNRLILRNRAAPKATHLKRLIDFITPEKSLITHFLKI